jgi:hypothetical protein
MVAVEAKFSTAEAARKRLASEVCLRDYWVLRDGSAGFILARVAATQLAADAELARPCGVKRIAMRSINAEYHR